MKSDSPRKRRNAAARRWGFVILWMIVIFFGSSIPISALPKGPEFVPVLVHFGEYFVLAALLIWAVNHGFGSRVTFSPVLAAFVVSGFYGVLDELHQIYVPGRVADMLDLAVDTAGALAACLLVPLIVNLVHRARRDNTGKTA